MFSFYILPVIDIPILLTSGIWLNTDTLGMAGKKIANENAINGADGEPSKYHSIWPGGEI